MKIHEYQAKNLFSQYGLPVDKNIIAHSVEEAIDAYNQLGCEKIVVKAQVHTGGRGKAGGVKLASSVEEVKLNASNIPGMNIKGFFVDRVLISEAVNISCRILC